jgi:uncharacterized protein (TIGR03083 family)
VTHDDLMALAATEYERLLSVVHQLDAEDWGKQTDNELWDVKAMLAHLLGTFESNADPAERDRQRALAAKAFEADGGYFIDALTDLQVREHADMTPDEMTVALVQMAPAALRGRTHVPAEVLATPFTPGPPFEGEWTLGYALGTIYTRDTWMHRVDLCRATGKELVLTADHDGVLMADVVEEWGRLHGQPFTLVLTGPGGGTFSRGDGGEQIELDAVEFCRILSGRGTASGLLTQGVAF